MRAVGTVVGLDPSRNNISFISPNNTVQTVTVHDPNTAAVAMTLQVGDKVDVTYTEGVAISLQPMG